MEENKYPFTFLTETSINLADDDELMRMMVKAGFDCVFIGIETPNEDSLIECSKVQNKNRDLIKCVKKLQNFGLQVQGGFIVGFDNDKDTIFDRMVDGWRKLMPRSKHPNKASVEAIAAYKKNVWENS